METMASASRSYGHKRPTLLAKNHSRDQKCRLQNVRDAGSRTVHKSPLRAVRLNRLVTVISKVSLAVPRIIYFRARSWRPIPDHWDVCFVGAARPNRMANVGGSGHRKIFRTNTAVRAADVKSSEQAQRFLLAHAMIYGHFRPRRRHMTAAAYRRARTTAFRVWRQSNKQHETFRNPPLPSYTPLPGDLPYPTTRSISCRRPLGR